MIATDKECKKLYGNIMGEVSSMARCACVSCNSCTCACSCRRTAAVEEINWDE